MFGWWVTSVHAPFENTIPVSLDSSHPVEYKQSPVFLCHQTHKSELKLQKVRCCCSLPQPSTPLQGGVPCPPHLGAPAHLPDNSREQRGGYLLGTRPRTPEWYLGWGGVRLDHLTPHWVPQVRWIVNGCLLIDFSHRYVIVFVIQIVSNLQKIIT